MKNKIFGFVLSLSLLPLSSCFFSSIGKVSSLSAPYLTQTSGTIRISKDSEDILVSPFDTSIYGSLYYYQGTYSDEQLSEITEKFGNDFSFFHALSDRHNYYCLYDTSDEQTQINQPKINNLKVVNDSYGTGEEIVLDDFLYSLLKKSYQFTLDSDGLFNMFLGTVNDIYEAKQEELSDYDSSLSKALSLANNFTFASDVDAEEISQAIAFVPSTKDEISSMLTFNDEKKSVIFNRLSKTGFEDKKVSISLGGNAKGEATEYVAANLEKEYPDICLVIDSGSSSIKVTFQRPDEQKWNIRLTNPVYAQSLDASEYNSTEISFSHLGEFTISTSGYYMQYFYVYDQAKDEYIRRSHIINPLTGYSENFFDQICVMMPDSGLADMYTTALMNTTSVTQASSLFDTLNQKYGVEEASLILCYKSNDDGSLYQYRNSELTGLSQKGLPVSYISQAGVEKEYSGDYSDVSVNDIKSVSTKSERSFQERFLVSESVFSDFSVISDTQILSHPDKIISVLDKIS
ncbi:MAG: FAD:protein FMN transferase [Bacilli bacterium]